MDEQADPEELIGAVEFEYEPGVGLTYVGEIHDEGIATRTDLGLVDVSPDIHRRLGEQPADSVYEVDEIVVIPYLTILDRGAGDAAEIEMVGEALAATEVAGYLERSAGGDVHVDVEQL